MGTHRIDMPSKRKPDPIIPPRLPSLLLHSRHVPLLLEHLGILGHVRLGLERVKVADIRFAVEHGDEGWVAGAQRGEGDGGEEGEGLDVGEGREAVFGVCDEPGEVSLESKGPIPQRGDSPNHSVPGDIAQVKDEVLGTIIHRPPEDLVPVLEVGPGLFRRVTGEWREALHGVSCKSCFRMDYTTHAEELEQDTAERPVIRRVGVCLAAQDLWRHANFISFVHRVRPPHSQLTSPGFLRPSRPTKSAEVSAPVIRSTELTYRGSAIRIERYIVRLSSVERKMRS